MILSWLAPASAFLKRVPWQVWCGIAVVLACWLWGNHMAAQERAEIKAELAQAEADAVRTSYEAAANADTEAAIAADEEAAVIADLTDRIEQAEATDANPLDSLF